MDFFIDSQEFASDVKELFFHSHSIK